MTGAPFAEPKAAALALLNSDTSLSRKAGSFLGQVVVDPTPLSPAQRSWISLLLKRGQLPELMEDAE